MGTDLGDVDGDGRPGLIAANFQGESASTYLQEPPIGPGQLHSARSPTPWASASRRARA